MEVAGGEGKQADGAQGRGNGGASRTETQTRRGAPRSAGGKGKRLTEHSWGRKAFVRETQNPVVSVTLSKCRGFCTAKGTIFGEMLRLGSQTQSQLPSRVWVCTSALFLQIRSKRKRLQVHTG